MKFHHLQSRWNFNIHGSKGGIGMSTVEIPTVEYVYTTTNSCTTAFRTHNVKPGRPLAHLCPVFDD